MDSRLSTLAIVFAVVVATILLLRSLKPQRPKYTIANTQLVQNSHVMPMLVSEMTVPQYPQYPQYSQMQVPQMPQMTVPQMTVPQMTVPVIPSSDDLSLYNNTIQSNKNVADEKVPSSYDLEEQSYDVNLLNSKHTPKKSKLKIVNGITNSKDNFFIEEAKGGTSGLGEVYTPELFKKVMFADTDKIKVFNPNFTNIMSMVPDLYKNNNINNNNKPSYEPVLLNDVDGSYFNKDIINLNQDSQYINAIYNEMSNDTDNQYFEGNYNVERPKNIK